MKAHQRGLLQDICSGHGVNVSQMGRKSGANWGGIYHSHGQGISAKDIQEEFAAAGFEPIDRVTANKIATFLNKQVSMTDEGEVDVAQWLQDSGLEWYGNALQQRRAPAEAAGAGAEEVEAAGEVDAAADLVIDLMRKDNPPESSTWIRNLSLGLLSVSPLLMFSALGGPNIVCGEDNERHCSPEAKVIIEALFATFFGFGSVALIGAFTAFSMNAPKDRDLHNWIEDVLPRAPLARLGGAVRSIGELSLGVASSAGMMMFITMTIRYFADKLTRSLSDDPYRYQDNAALAALNSALLIIAGYACIAGNKGNIHNLHQRAYHKEWREIYHLMQSFDQATREQVGRAIVQILGENQAMNADKFRRIIQTIQATEVDQLISPVRYNIYLAGGALILAASAIAQYFHAGCDAVPYFSSVFSGKFPAAINIETPDTVPEWAFGVTLTATNFMVMINALLNYLNDRFTVGQTPERDRLQAHRKTASLLALLPAGAALSQVFVLNPSASILMKVWEYSAGGMTAFQSWLFGVVGASFVLKNISEKSQCCQGRGYERLPDAEAGAREDSPLIVGTPRSSAQGEDSASIAAFNQMLHSVGEILKSSNSIPLPQGMAPVPTHHLDDDIGPGRPCFHC